MKLFDFNFPQLLSITKIADANYRSHDLAQIALMVDKGRSSTVST